ncbi:MAG: hypothetical protein QOK19_1851 [Solirubrobacteraceae bacterium]|jgi:hypothetical protein|nr:hypothetical protein [Solirubrobacterales bacterium]MEA2216290.1 hypothetical protein [Solirubrobacteraceae bacterium]
MTYDLRRPDLAVVMPLDPHTPRSARHCVGQVDHPSPDLRDAVMLLCSELVTQAVERSEGDSIEVRVWMPEDVVRVELLGSPHSLSKAHRDHADYAALLLDQLSDRWELETGEDFARVWFEIDRHPAGRPLAETY